MLKYLVAFMFIAEAAIAQCDCGRSIPVSGQYEILGPDFSDFVDVEVTDGPNGECGTDVALLHPQSDAFLTCQGDQYVGEIVHMNQPMLMGGEQSSPFMTTGTRFKGVIQRPGLIALIPGEPFTPNFTLNLVSPSGIASPCMCKNVQGWITHSRGMQAKYADQNTLAYAVSNKVAAIDHLKPAWPDVKSDSDTAYTPLQSTSSTYQKSVTDQLSQTVPPGEDAITYSSNAAETDPTTCHITNALPRSNDGICRPAIVMQALREHEEVHSDRCVDIKELSGNDNGYLYWSNHPPNHSLDEIEAYQKVLDILEPWHASNCQ